MLSTSAGVEPATSWSPVGRRIHLSHRGRLGDKLWAAKMFFSLSSQNGSKIFPLTKATTYVINMVRCTCLRLYHLFENMPKSRMQNALINHFMHKMPIFSTVFPHKCNLYTHSNIIVDTSIIHPLKTVNVTKSMRRLSN